MLLFPTLTTAHEIDISGWRLVQEEAHHEFIIPEETIIGSESYVIVARNCAKEEFEAFWGINLPVNVVFLNSQNTVPQINGDETFNLKDSFEERVDGTTVPMGREGGETVQRNNPGDAPDEEASWTRFSTDLATPGSGAGTLSNSGIVINEFSDATGSGNYIFEFVELFNDDRKSEAQTMSLGVLKSVLR
jgi:hypothetical protein